MNEKYKVLIYLLVDQRRMFSASTPPPPPRKLFTVRFPSSRTCFPSRGLSGSRDKLQTLKCNMSASHAVQQGKKKEAGQFCPIFPKSLCGNCYSVLQCLTNRGLPHLLNCHVYGWIKMFSVLFVHCETHFATLPEINFSVQIFSICFVFLHSKRRRQRISILEVIVICASPKRSQQNTLHLKNIFDAHLEYFFEWSSTRHWWH
jgi:hypothetical protein